MQMASNSGIRSGGQQDRFFNTLMTRVLEINPMLNVLSPKTEAAYQAFIAKKHKQQSK